MTNLAKLVEALQELPNRHPFALLAALPGVIGLYNLASVWQSFSRLKKTIEKIRDRVREREQQIPTGFHVDLEDYRPRRFYTICGAIVLTLVFGMVAALSGANSKPMIDLGALYEYQSKTDAPLFEQQRHGLAGLVFAGYGAYLYTLTLCISRLYSSALTGKFLTVSALRSAIALVLGFTAGATNVFGSLGAAQALFIFFFVGLFPSWAMDALSRKAQEFFKTRVVGVDFLPLRLIDGIDDGIADRLAEIGVWDIQHLAAADPYGLAARTLYPPLRVIDWVDQAILIGYVRQEIAHFRALGIRGSIDFAALFRDLMGIKYKVAGLGSAGGKRYRRVLRERSRELFDDLSKKTHMSRPSLEAVGRSLYDDQVVQYLWSHWSTQEQAAATVTVPAAAPTALAPAPV